VTDDLAGFTVAVTAHRLVREQSLLFERAHATVVHLPFVGMELSPESEAQEAIREVIERPPPVAVFSTGFGTRWLFAIADAIGEAEAFRAAVDSGYVVARGPKARGALTTAGVHVDWQAPGAVGEEVERHLATRIASGTSVFVQLDGVSDGLACHVGNAGGLVRRVRTYRCCPATSGPDPVTALGGVDAVTFTSPVAVTGMVALAGAELDATLTRLSSIVVAAVGPVTARALTAVGIDHAVVPDEHRMGAMVRATAAALAGRACSLAPGVEMRGATVVIDEEPVAHPPGELRLLRALVDAQGSVVGKVSLAKVAGVESDDGHAVEAVVARLRRRLGPAAPIVETIPRRGYRFSAPQ
jgi:uroporphyrinogen-III synthase